GPEEGNLDGVRRQPRAIEQIMQWCAGPFGRADRAVLPRLTLPSRIEPGTTVPRALKRHPHGFLRELSDLCHGDLKRHLHPAADLDGPAGGRGHVWDVKVDEEVVKSGRRQVVAQRLEWESRVPVREGNFLALEVTFDMGPLLGAEEGVGARTHPAISPFVIRSGMLTTVASR